MKIAFRITNWSNGREKLARINGTPGQETKILKRSKPNAED